MMQLLETLEAFVHTFNNDTCLLSHLNFLLPSNEMVAFVILKASGNLASRRGGKYMHDTKTMCLLKRPQNSKWNKKNI